MNRFRLFFVIIFFVLVTVWMLPNFVNVRWGLSDNKLNFGLDIQGGLHLVMGVDVEGVVKEKIERMRLSLQEELKEEGFTVQISSQKEGALEVLRVEMGEEKEDEKGKDGNLFAGVGTGKNIGEVDKWFKENYAQSLLIFKQDNQKLFLRYQEFYLKEEQKRIMDQAVETLRSRIDEFGVAEPLITLQGQDRILIQLPGLKNAEKAKALIQSTAKLKLAIVVEDKMDAAQLQQHIADAEKAGKYSLSSMSYIDYVRRLNEDLKDKLPKETELLFARSENAKNMEAGKVPYLLSTTSTMEGDLLRDAYVNYDQFQNPIVELIFNALGAKQFGTLTGENVKKYMAIVLDKVVKSAPVIQARIGGGRAQITLGGGRDATRMQNEAQMIAMSLRAGALPATLKQLEERTVGPTLGRDLVQKAQMAGWLAVVLVIGFMIFYYKLVGVVASLCLSLNVLGILALLSSLQATLTLPGIAGIILTVGIAVDANVIIYERIKEELKMGSGLVLAIKEGYQKALSAILDANITTAATAFVLWYFGSGPIRGFAVTLLIGILTTLFTAVFLSHFFIQFLVQKQKRQLHRFFI